MKKMKANIDIEGILYDQFRSNDVLINSIMDDDGEQSLDRQIVKMMKDMHSDEILQFSQEFFKFGRNDCKSLKKIISKELTSRTNLHKGAGAINIQQSEQTQSNPSQTVHLSMIKNSKQNEQDEINDKDIQQQLSQVGVICTKINNMKIQQIQIYRSQFKHDKDYYSGQPEQFMEIHNEATTIQEDDESNQFQQVSREQLSDGKTRVTYNNGDVYEGQMEGDIKNGQGQYFYSTGQKYSGYFQDDEIQGYGRYVFLSGAEYEGDWSSGMKHGLGILTFSNHDVYEGSFSNELFHGKGIYKYENGDFFKGIWKQGLRNGKGCFEGADGSIKIGTWVNDRFQI